MIKFSQILEAKVKSVSTNVLHSYILKNVKELDNELNNTPEDKNSSYSSKNQSQLDQLINGLSSSYYFFCDEKDISIIDQKLQKVGWFVAKKSKNLVSSEIVIQPYYTEKSTWKPWKEDPTELDAKQGFKKIESTVDLFDANAVPRYLYHFTSINNIDKIKKQGLIPKGSSGKFSYPHRVYFFDDMPANEVMLSMAKDVGHEIKTRDDIAIVKVDTKKIGRNIPRFYKDASIMFGSFWTYHHVPASAIVSIKKFNDDGWWEET
jgi:hypothetical protein